MNRRKFFTTFLLVATGSLIASSNSSINKNIITIYDRKLTKMKYAVVEIDGKNYGIKYSYEYEAFMISEYKFTVVDALVRFLYELNDQKSIIVEQSGIIPNYLPILFTCDQSRIDMESFVVDSLNNVSCDVYRKMSMSIDNGNRSTSWEHKL